MRKIFTILAVVMLILYLSACKSENENNVNTPKPFFTESQTEPSNDKPTKSSELTQLNPLNDSNANPSETQKELLASIPEKGIYAYAYFIEGKTEITDYGSFVGDVDIYLEVDDKVEKWLYERSLARSEFRFYNGEFFNNHTYLVFIDYEHGGHGGGSEGVMVFDGEEYSIIPFEQMKSKYQLTDNNDIIITINEWQIEISADKLLETETYRHGNRFDIEDDCLVEYFYYGIDGLSFAPCLKAEYVLEDGKIRIGTLSFVDDKEYYE